jgi:glutamyl-tRNA synthetase
VRVRYAPSPTGSMHLGGLRTALYNYLFAHSPHSVASSSDAASTSPSSSSSSSSSALAPRGRFLIRIEDTDRKRLVATAVPELLSAMKWAGVKHDEGPGCTEEENRYGPYVQSERLHIYSQAIQPLLASGAAYPCFCTAERLQSLRDSQVKKGLPSMYDRLCHSMPAAERAAKLQECKDKSLPYVIRMLIPPGETSVTDVIRGSVSFPNKTLDDQVLLKSDGFPTYHFACVVDDHAMGITHVIRGDEWLTSTPKHVLLYKALGWTVPAFAHLPLLLKPDGTKLSKRHADSSLDYYIHRGYLPSAVVNFVALLGWNPGTTQEVFTLEELTRQFDLRRIQKAGAVVNLEKLNWFNQQHMIRLAQEDIDGLAKMVRPWIEAHYSNPATSSSARPLPSDLSDPELLKRVIYSLVAHVHTVDQFAKESGMYYAVPRYQDETDKKLQELKNKLYPDAAAVTLNRKLVKATIEKLQSLPDSAFDLAAAPSPTSSPAAAASPAATTPSSSAPPSSSRPHWTDAAATVEIQTALKGVIKEQGVKQKELWLLMRYILTGMESGPSQWRRTHMNAVKDD